MLILIALLYLVAFTSALAVPLNADINASPFALQETEPSPTPNAHSPRAMLPMMSSTLPEAIFEDATKELVEIGTTMGHEIADELVKRGINVAVDTLIAAATAALAASLELGTGQLPVAIIAFLLKLDIPMDVAEQIAKKVLAIVFDQWIAVADQLSGLSKKAIEEIVKGLAGHLRNTAAVLKELVPPVIPINE